MADNWKEKFTGDLIKINPELLVKQNSVDRFDAFFIMLGVVFNDLKGLFLFDKILAEKYQAPSPEEVSSHAGNFGGVVVQIDKLIAATVNEFFVSIKKNSDLFTKVEMRQLFSRLSKGDQAIWNKILAAANQKLPDTENLLRSIAMIRSNLAFHYDHSGKFLLKAYKNAFFSKAKNPNNEWAYYSIGNTIADTRFYFADLTIDEALKISAGLQFKDLGSGVASWQAYRAEIRDAVDAVIAALSSMLKNYLQFRRNQPR